MSTLPELFVAGIECIHKSFSRSILPDSAALEIKRCVAGIIKKVTNKPLAAVNVDEIGRNEEFVLHALYLYQYLLNTVKNKTGSLPESKRLYSIMVQCLQITAKATYDFEYFPVRFFIPYFTWCLANPTIEQIKKLELSFMCYIDWQVSAIVNEQAVPELLSQLLEYEEKKKSAEPVEEFAQKIIRTISTLSMAPQCESFLPSYQKFSNANGMCVQITDEQMAASSFGQGTHTAKIKKRGMKS